MARAFNWVVVLNGKFVEARAHEECVSPGEDNNNNTVDNYRTSFRIQSVVCPAYLFQLIRAGNVLYVVRARQLGPVPRQL